MLKILNKLTAFGIIIGYLEVKGDLPISCDK